MDQIKETKERPGPLATIQNVTAAENAKVFAGLVKYWINQLHIDKQNNFFFLDSPKAYSALFSEPQSFPDSSSSERDAVWNLSVPLSSFAIDVSDFREISESKYRFIDKTLLIEKVFDEKKPVKVIVRSRGSGKTFNLSMLRTFLSNKCKDRSILFKKLNIGRKEEFYEKHHAQYPVIFVTFKEIQAETYEQAIEKFGQWMIKFFEEQINEHGFKGRGDLELLKTHSLDEGILQSSLERLTSHLYNHYKKRVILLLDDYDALLHSAYMHTTEEIRESKHSYYQKMLIFMRRVFESVLKENSCLQMAVLTGSPSVETESLFSGINIDIHDGLGDGLNEYFGFTQEEVFEQFQDAFPDISPEQLNIISSHYGNERLGNQELFNPREIIKVFERCWEEGMEFLTGENFFPKSDDMLPKEDRKIAYDTGEEKTAPDDLKKIYPGRVLSEQGFYKKYLDDESRNTKLPSMYACIMQGNADVLIIEKFIKSMGSGRAWWAAACQVFQNSGVIHQLDNRASTKRIARCLLKEINQVDMGKGGKFIARILNNLKRSEDVIVAVVEELRASSLEEGVKCIEALGELGSNYLIVSEIFSACLVDVELDIRKTKAIFDQLISWLIEDSHVALETVLQGIMSPWVFVQINCIAMLSLGWKDGEIIVKKLKSYLTSDEFLVRLVAMQSLGELASHNNEAALAVMDEALSKANEGDCLVWLSALEGDDEGDPRSFKGSRAAVKAAERFLMADLDAHKMIKQIAKWAGNGNKDALEVFRKSLDSQSIELQKKWLKALEEGVIFGSKEIIELLRSRLAIESNQSMRDSILQVLKKWAEKGSKNAFDVVINCMETSVYGDVLEECVWILGYGKTELEIMESIEKSFGEPDSKIHFAWIFYLSKWAGYLPAYGGPQDHQKILNFLSRGLRSDSPIAVRRKCAMTLKEIPIINQVISNSLRKCLRDPDAELRKVTLTTVKSQSIEGDEMAVNLLLEGLSSKYSDVREECARGLQKTKAYHMVVTLGQLMKKDNISNVRGAAIETLTAWAIKGNISAWNFLVEGLSFKWPDVREKCALGLGKTKNFEYIEEVLECLNDSEPEVRRAAATALCEWAVRGDGKAFRVLERCLEDPVSRKGWLAVLQKIEAGNEVVIELLGKYLDDKDLAVRSRVIAILKKWLNKKNNAIANVLMKGLISLYSDVCNACRAMLCELEGLPKNLAEELLVPFLSEVKESKTVQSDVRISVVSIFMHWSLRGSSESLSLKIIKSELTLQETRKSCLELMLSRYKWIDSFQVIHLVEQLLLEDIDIETQEMAIKILTSSIENDRYLKLTHSVLISGLRSPREKVREFCAKAIQRNLKEQEFLDPLITLLKDESPKVRATTIKTFAMWGVDKWTNERSRTWALEALIKGLSIEKNNTYKRNDPLWDKVAVSLENLLMDKAECVRSVAIDVLSACVNIGFSKKAVSILKKGLSSNFEDVQLQCILALQDIPVDTKSMIQSLQDFLVNPKSTVVVREAAIAGLLKWMIMGNSTALTLFKQGLSAQEKEVREEWIGVLKKADLGSVSIVKLLEECMHGQKAEFSIIFIDLLMKWTIDGNEAAAELLIKVLAMQPVDVQKRGMLEWKEKTKESSQKVIELTKRLESVVLSSGSILESKSQFLSIKEDVMSGKKQQEVNPKKVNPTQTLRDIRKEIPLTQHQSTVLSTPQPQARGKVRGVNDPPTNVPASTDSTMQSSSSSSTSYMPNPTQTQTQTQTQIEPQVSKKRTVKQSARTTKKPIDDNKAQPATKETEQLVNPGNENVKAGIIGEPDNWIEVEEGAELYAIKKSDNKGSAIVRHVKVAPYSLGAAISTDDDAAALKYVKIKQDALAAATSGAEAYQILDQLKGQHQKATREELEILKQRLDIDAASEKEREEIFKDEKLIAYYQTLKEIHTYFGAAKSIETGLINPADNTKALVVKGAGGIVKHIPIIGLGGEILTQILLAKNSMEQYQAMERLGKWAPGYAAADRLAERFARKMTLLRKDEILKPPTPKEKWNKKFTHANGIVEKARAALVIVGEAIGHVKDEAQLKALEAKKGVTYSNEQRLALADSTRVVEAIMDGGIKCQNSLREHEQLEVHLREMLGLFPELQPQALLTQAPLLQSSSSSSMQAPRHGGMYHHPQPPVQPTATSSISSSVGQEEVYEPPAKTL